MPIYEISALCGELTDKLRDDSGNISLDKLTEEDTIVFFETLFANAQERYGKNYSEDYVVKFYVSDPRGRKTTLYGVRFSKARGAEYSVSAHPTELQLNKYTIEQHPMIRILSSTLFSDLSRKFGKNQTKQASNWGILNRRCELVAICYKLQSADLPLLEKLLLGKPKFVSL